MNSRSIELPSITVDISRFPDNNFKGLYLKKEWIFFGVLLHFWNVHEINKILKKKKSNLALLLPKLLHPKKMFT